MATLDNLTGRKGAVEPNGMSDMPTISRAGNYFRTVAYTQPGMDGVTTLSIRQEAVQHPTTSQWRIQEVILRPNVVSADPPLVEDYRDVLDAMRRPLMLPLAEAIAHLATFEAANRQMGLEVQGSSADELGDDHVVVFAGRNGYAIDVTGKAHATAAGRIVTKGWFAPETRLKVMDLYAREAFTPAPTDETPLARIFRNNSMVENFDRLLAHKIDLSRWNKFVSRMDKVVETLCQIQDSNYKEDEKSRFGGMVTVNYVKYEEEYRDAIKQALNALSTITFFTPEQKKSRFERMLDEIHLVYEVAYAKALYAKLNRSDEPEKHQEELSKKVKDAARHCRAVLGGSETDIQRMQSEIIENNPRFSIGGEDKRRVALYSVFKKHNLNTSHDLYFMPDQVGEILKALDSTTAELEKVVADEKKRIQTVTPQAEAIENRNKTGQKPDTGSSGPR